MKILFRGSVSFLLFWIAVDAQDSTGPIQQKAGATASVESAEETGIEIPTRDHLIELQKKGNPEGAAFPSVDLFEDRGTGRAEVVAEVKAEPVPMQAPQSKAPLEESFEPVDTVPQPQVKDQRPEKGRFVRREFRRVDPYEKEGGFPPSLTYFSSEWEGDQPPFYFLHRRGRSSSVVGKVELVTKHREIPARLPDKSSQGKKPEKALPPSAVDPEIRIPPGRRHRRISAPRLDLIAQSPLASASPATVRVPTLPPVVEEEEVSSLEKKLISAIRKPVESLTGKRDDIPRVVVKKPSQNNRTNAKAGNGGKPVPVATATPIPPDNLP